MTARFSVRVGKTRYNSKPIMSMSPVVVNWATDLKKE
jgi:hypothetical protein